MDFAIRVCANATRVHIANPHAGMLADDLRGFLMQEVLPTMSGLCRIIRNQREAAPSPRPCI
jgi:hypothetical protein